MTTTVSTAVLKTLMEEAARSCGTAAQVAADPARAAEVIADLCLLAGAVAEDRDRLRTKLEEGRHAGL